MGKVWQHVSYYPNSTRYYAANAVDGDKETITTAIGGNAYWAVDLGDTYRKIRIVHYGFDNSLGEWNYNLIYLVFFFLNIYFELTSL